jgi:copper chaperone CopZ
MSDKTVTLNITGMSCMGCVSSVTSSLKKLDGVTEVSVTLKPGAATVTYDAAKVGVEDLKGRVVAAGYGVDGIPATHGH